MTPGPPVLPGGGAANSAPTSRLDWGAARSKSVTWYAPEATVAGGAGLSGLEFMQALMDGRVAPAPMALLLYTLVVVWFHVTGHLYLRFPWRPWYRRKQEPSFADLLTTLRRVSYEEKTTQLQSDGCRTKA